MLLQTPTGQRSRLLNLKPKSFCHSPCSGQPRQTGSELALAQQSHARIHPPPKPLPISQTSGCPVIKGQEKNPLLQESATPGAPMAPNLPSPGGSQLSPAFTVEVSGASVKVSKAGIGKDSSASPVHTRGGGVGVQMPQGHSKIPVTEERGDPTAPRTREASHALGGAVIYLF